MGILYTYPSHELSVIQNFYRQNLERPLSPERPTSQAEQHIFLGLPALLFSIVFRFALQPASVLFRLGALFSCVL